jgi:glucosamine--fructose-6-phosphate aminotransferase (isomerizing)
MNKPMNETTQALGKHMRSEIAECPNALVTGLASVSEVPETLGKPDAIYTIARGSSDAAATVLNYEFMRVLRIPATTLPPSVFSLGGGISFSNAWTVTISQSGGSADLKLATDRAAQAGAKTVAITNVDASPVEEVADWRVPIGAGTEVAVPATKSVVGSIAAGLALLGGLSEIYRDALLAAMTKFDDDIENARITEHGLASKIANAQHIFVIGRQTTFGVAQEIALKIKETCGIHAEAYSASEVLHGPKQLAMKGLLSIVLDDQTPAFQAGLDLACDDLAKAGSEVVRPKFTLLADAPQALNAALILCQTYPEILEATVQLGIDPDAPSTLAKVTNTV